MDYKKTAEEVLAAAGGAGNIVSAAHCATRLRLVVANDADASKEKIEAVQGVKGVFQTQGQLQIIFGTGTVNKVYDEFEKMIGSDHAGSKDDVKKAAAAQMPVWKRLIKTVGDIFVPIIPAIVASGLLMGLLNGLVLIWPDMADNSLYYFLNIFSSAAFTFLPILIAVSAAKTFGGNIFLGAVIGMIMIHPNLINAWSAATSTEVVNLPVWFGLYSVTNVGYQGHVIPVVIAVWIMSMLEKWLHKKVPDIIDLFVTPLVTVLVTGYLAMTIIGPVFAYLETALLSGFEWLVAVPYGIGAFFMGALYAPTVVMGIHHMYNVIEAGMIASNGMNTWMPIASAANVAQGAAALAVALKCKEMKIKEMALPASLSAFLGITEPAIFGVNLRFFKPFLAGCIGGACGAMVSSILGVYANAYGVTGLFGFLITTSCSLGYLLTLVVAFAVSFVICWFMKIDYSL
ncbi:MAG: PTS transporter subunit EIIC [Bacilli bacterium]|jgi:PTS system sucrose-specific IIC component